MRPYHSEYPTQYLKNCETFLTIADEGTNSPQPLWSLWIISCSPFQWFFSRPWIVSSYAFITSPQQKSWSRSSWVSELCVCGSACVHVSVVLFSSTLPCKLWRTWTPQTACYVSTRGSCKAPPYAASWKPSLGSTEWVLGSHVARLVCFPVSRNHCLILPDVHYLKTTFHLFYLAFSLFQVGEHFQSLLLSSRQKQKFKHLPRFPFG